MQTFIILYIHSLVYIAVINTETRDRILILLSIKAIFGILSS